MKNENRILTLTFVFLMAFLAIGTFIKADVKFSENENRYLQSKPKLSLENIFSGDFESKIESYLSDQIIGREFWVENMAAIENSMGIKDVNGTYVGYNDRLFQRVTKTEFDEERLESNLLSIKNFISELKSEPIDVKVLLAPTAALVYEDKLPKGALNFDENKAFEKALDFLGDNFIDVRNTMKESASRCTHSSYYAPKMSGVNKGDKYYLTDHHWTGYGAFLAYRDYAKSIGIYKKAKLSRYMYTNPEILTEDFQGSLFSKVLFTRYIKDAIEVPRKAVLSNYKIEIEGKTYDSILFLDRLNKKDKYEVFFGGNYPRVDITTKSKGEKLLIIKDSYANSFIPYGLTDFEKITMVDTRFYKENMLELAKNYDKILFLYGVSNFANEKLMMTTSILG